MSLPVESVKIFKFRDDETDEDVQIRIPEVMDAAYGLYIWPSAPVLAQYIWNQRKWIQGRSVIELGAGTSLPGVLAAACGATVTLTDDARRPGCLANCRKSCQANGLEGRVRIAGLTWGAFPPEVFCLPRFDVILASDCFYDAKDFEDILATLHFFLHRHAGARCWISYQERSSDRSVQYLLLKWGLRCLHIPLGSFEARGSSVACRDLPGNHTIQLMEITRKPPLETPSIEVESP